MRVRTSVWCWTAITPTGLEEGGRRRRRRRHLQQQLGNERKKKAQFGSYLLGCVRTKYLAQLET